MTPDVSVADPSFRRSQRDNARPPFLLAIEIMSPEQTIPQMMKKARTYLDWGIQNVWIIDPEREFAVMIGSDGKSDWIWSGSDLVVQVDPEPLSIPLADLFA